MAGARRRRGALWALLAALLAALQASLCSSENNCENYDQCTQNTSNWTSLWYVCSELSFFCGVGLLGTSIIVRAYTGLILLTVFMLLLCGITASCVKFCCQKRRPPVQAFPTHPCDLTVIVIENDSTAHSTVTSYSSLQCPPCAPIPLSYMDMDRNTLPPPAYSLFAMELPPSYDEAIQIGKQYIETALVSQKLDDIPGQVIPGSGLNPIQCSLGTVNRDPATQPNSENSQDAAKEHLSSTSFQVGNKARGGL